MGTQLPPSLQVLRVRDMLKRGLGVHHAGEQCCIVAHFSCCTLTLCPVACKGSAPPAVLGVHCAGGCPPGRPLPCVSWSAVPHHACRSLLIIFCQSAAVPRHTFAGLLPIVKEIVEMLFCRGVIKVG